MRLLLALVLLAAVACTPRSENPAKTPKSPAKPPQKVEATFPKEVDLSTKPGTTMLPTLEHRLPADKNALWCATLPLAWQHLRDTLGPIHVNPHFTDLVMLNTSTSYLNALQKDEYKAEITYREGFVEVRTSYQKTLPFEDPWPVKDYSLAWGEEKEKVKAFGVFGETHRVKILFFNSDDDFALRLHVADENQEILLYAPPRGTSYPTLGAALGWLQRKQKQGELEEDKGKQYWRFMSINGDQILIPNLALNLSTNYKQLVNGQFRTMTTAYTITKAWQRIAFVLNEKGAKLESEGELRAEAAFEKKPEPKHFVFDRPFLLVVKAKDQPNPHFVAWIANTELMEPIRIQ